MSEHSCQTSGQQGRAATSTTSLVIVCCLVHYNQNNARPAGYAHACSMSTLPFSAIAHACRIRLAAAQQAHQENDSGSVQARTGRRRKAEGRSLRDLHTAARVWIHDPSTLPTRPRRANDKSDRVSARMHPCIRSPSARSAAAWEAAAPISAASRRPCSLTTSSSSVPRRPRGQ